MISGWAITLAVAILFGQSHAQQQFSPNQFAPNQFSRVPQHSQQQFAPQQFPQQPQFAPRQAQPVQSFPQAADPRLVNHPSQAFGGQQSPAQHQPQPAPLPPTTPAPSHPPAQVHYVNIGPQLQGDYKFGYDTGKGPLGQSFREEVRLPDGTVMGAYGYVDAEGRQRVVKYRAGKEGFTVEGDTAPEGAPAASPTARQAAPRPQPRPQPAPQPAPIPQPRPAPVPVHRSVNPVPVPQPRPFQPIPQPQPAPAHHQQIPPQAQQFRPPQQFAPQPQPQFQPQPQPQFQPRPQAQQFAPQAAGPAPRQQFPAGLAPSIDQLRSSAALGQPRSSSSGDENENHGPVVIDTSLLSYNIGQANRG